MANGEGYLRRRGENVWLITIFLGKKPDGKANQLTRTVHGTEKEAQTEMARLIAERDGGVDLKPQRITITELMTRWQEVRAPDLAASTAATYETLLRVHVEPVIGHVRLRDLKPLHVEAVKTAVLKGGRSPKSALNVFRLLGAVLDQAVRWQLLARNPCTAVQAPRPRRFVPHTPLPEELERILAVADRSLYGPVARLATLTGARQGETLSLRWRDVDWQEMRLTVPGTKTQASARIVDLGQLAIDLLREHRQHEKEKRLSLGSGVDCGSDEATIFTSKIGRPIVADALKRKWRRIIRDAGFGHVRFHGLRHASATYLLRAGVPVQMVSQRLGHSRTSTTTDIYAHVLPGMGRAAAEALDNVMVPGWSKTKESY